MAGHHICKEILFEVSGNAVDIARAHEIDLCSTFNSVDFRGGNSEGKAGGKNSERNKVDKGGEGERRVVLEEGKELKVVVANLRGEKKTKGEGGAVAKVGSVGEGCGGPKFIEKAGDNAGRQRGQYICYICTGILV